MDAGYRKISWLLSTSRVSGIAFLNENLLTNIHFYQLETFIGGMALANFKFYYLYKVSDYSAHMYACVLHASLMPMETRSQKKDHFRLWLQTVVSHHESIVNQFQVLW